MFRSLSALVLSLALGGVALAAEPAPSRPSLDAPELARLGPYKVGVRSISLTEARQVDVLGGPGAVKDRVLPVEVWYPATPADGAEAVIYHGALPGEPPRGPAAFTVPGIAVRDAAAAKGAFPLVILSHGYSNTPEAMSWLGENLASKGYVVAAIHHNDPEISDRTKFAEPMLRRPLDIAFVAHTLQAEAKAGAPGLASADPSRVALIGYSMGGYGVLIAAGGGLDPNGALVKAVPGGALEPYAQGGARQGDLAIPGLKAVVALSPAGVRFGAWGATGLSGITAPLMVIGGDHDATVGYADGIKPVFDQATRSDRYLLVYQNAGHSIGMSSAPPEMRERLFDFHWFEDSVWRKDRIMGIDQHFITAFLDRETKGDQSRSAYLDSDVVQGGEGAWPASLTAYEAVSPGGPGATWKGFFRNTAVGIELHHMPAAR